MSVDWRFGAQPPRDAGRADEPAAPPSRARRAALVLAVAAAGALVVVALHAWRNAVVLARIADDVRAVVVAEEAARARGDGEVARMHQTVERRRRLRAPSADEALAGLPAPLPGLEVVGPGEVADVDVQVGDGGRIQRASALLAYAVTDGEVTGTFRVERPMELDADGRWRHGLRPPANDESGAARRTIAQPSLTADAPEADAAWLAPALARAAETRARYCRLVPCAELGQRGLALALEDIEPGTATWRREDPAAFPILVLPAPSLWLRPDDAAAEALLGRAVVRLVLAVHVRTADRLAGRAFDPSGPASAFAVGLAEALLDADAFPEDPERWGGPPPEASWSLEGIWPGALERSIFASPAPPRAAANGPAVRRAARSFGAHVARLLGPEALTRLAENADRATRRSPRWEDGGVATTPTGWLADALQESVLEAVLDWPRPQVPAPPGTGFLASCLLVAKGAPLSGEPLLVRPGERPRQVAKDLCGGSGRMLGQASAAHGRVAAVCSALPGDEAGSRPASAQLAVLEPDGSVRRAPLVGAPQLSFGAPTWSADGRWLAFDMVDLAPSRWFVVEPWVADLGRDAEPIVATPLSRVALEQSEWAEASRYELLAWQPAGRQLARVALDGDVPTVEVRVAGTEEPSWTLPGMAPAWSPDGRRLAIVETSSGTTVTLAVAAADTGEVTARRAVDLRAALGERWPIGAASEPAVVSDLVWSPDGAWLAARVGLLGQRVTAQLVWQPATARVQVVTHGFLSGLQSAWRSAWHPELPLVATLPDATGTWPLSREASAPLPAFDVAAGRTRALTPDDPAYDALRWQRTPGGTRRVRFDDQGRLLVEPVAGGEAWRLNVGACSARVDWLDAAAE